MHELQNTSPQPRQWCFRNINVKFDPIANANHFFKGKEKELSSTLESYIKDKITVI